MGVWTGAEHKKDRGPKTPARTRRAMGRIEHWLLDRGRTSTLSDLRPSPEPPHHTTKVTNVSIYDKWPGHPEGYPGPVGAKARPKQRGKVATGPRRSLDPNTSAFNHC